MGRHLGGVRLPVHPGRDERAHHDQIAEIVVLDVERHARRVAAVLYLANRVEQVTPHSDDLAIALAKVLVMIAKVSFMIFFIMWVRWTLPRFRYDQLMDLAWKSLIPLGLINLVATAAIVQLIRG